MSDSLARAYGGMDGKSRSVTAGAAYYIRNDHVDSILTQAMYGTCEYDNVGLAFP